MKTSYGIIGLAVVGVLALVGVAGVLASALPDVALAAVATLAVAAVPVAFWVGWRLGSRDARSFVSGIERGTGTVIGAGSQVADLRQHKAAAMRQAATPAVRLPDSTRLEIVSGDGGTVEL